MSILLLRVNLFSRYLLVRLPHESFVVFKSDSSIHVGKNTLGEKGRVPNPSYDHHHIADVTIHKWGIGRITIRPDNGGILLLMWGNVLI